MRQRATSAVHLIYTYFDSVMRISLSPLTLSINFFIFASLPTFRHFSAAPGEVEPQQE